MNLLPNEMTADALVAELLNHYRVFHKPNSPEEAMWSRSMSSVLGGYKPAVLAQTCARILKTRKNDKFPLPAEIAAIADEIEYDLNRLPMLEKARDEVFDGRKAPPYSRARTKLVLDMIRGGMGRRAAADGWIGQLVDYVREHAALPDERRVAHLQREAREAYEIRVQCHAGVGWPSTPGGLALAAMCARLGDTIERRNQLWARVVLGQESEEALFRAIPKDLDEGAAA